MANYKISIHPHDVKKLVQYDVNAQSEAEARAIGNTRYFKEHPHCSHNLDHYVTSCSNESMQN